MSNTIKNHDLIFSAQQGNTKATNAIFEIYKPMVEYHIRKYKVESHEDAAMEIMGKVLRHISTFDFTNEFSTWVYTISENHCIDILRKSKLKTVSIYDTNENGKEFAENITDYSMSAHQRMEKEERISNLLLAIEKLSPSEKQCLLLQIEGKKMEEMACELSLSIGAIKSKIHRAKEKLSKMQLS